ncbi:hypothetical protein [Bradyrhizobium elkanii]|uniref:hypothetical protein n=1 Tax=Bradyrhizobium elkanii TaxID=29448 RepID=UPI0012FDC909|nr:hypothetical protein [Bradyrhizobium elkanii]
MMMSFLAYVLLVALAALLEDMRAPAIKFAEARHRSGPPPFGEQSSERTGVTQGAEDRSCNPARSLVAILGRDFGRVFFSSPDVMG